MVPKRKHILRFSAVMAIIFAFMCFISELAARYWITRNPDETSDQATRLWLVIYDPAPYLSDEFLKETREVNKVFALSGNGYEIAENYDGQYIHVVDRKRVTADQPSQADHTIYIFGDSTLFSNNVPDEFTIPSQVQKMFNNAGGLRYRVINLGIPAMNSKHALSKLREIPLNLGDKVVFYTGLADFEEIYQTAVRQREQDIPHQLCSWLRQSFEHMAVSTLYCQWVDENFPPQIDDSAFWQAKIANIVLNYQDNIHAAQEISGASGASFYSFLPPQIWSHPLNDFEQKIADNHTLVSRGRSQVFTQAWSVFEAAQQKLSDAGVRAFDLTHALDFQRADGKKKIFFDCCHINDHGNAIIAAAIFKVITLSIEI